MKIGHIVVEDLKTGAGIKTLSYKIFTSVRKLFVVILLMRRELIFAKEMHPVIQVSLLIANTLVQLFYMIKVQPFETMELNYVEIFNTIVLYFFSVMMLLKTNNPWNPDESGIYLSPN